MIRVLFVDHAEALGGAEHSLLLLLRHLDRERFSPLLACNRGPLAQAARDCPVDVCELPMPRLRRSPAAPFRLTRGAAALARLIRREGVELVHCNVLRAAYYTALAAHWTGRPLVWHVRDILAPGPGVRWLARRAARVIAVSQAAARPLPTGTPVTVVPNGVDVSALARRPAEGMALRQVLGLPAGAQVVGLVGRLEPWKGQADFVRAMAQVRAGWPNARFLLVGGSIFGGGEGYRRELDNLVRALGLDERVLMLGQRDDLQAVYSALDVLVHCSTEPEPFGRVMIEAMAAALPVVAYDHGGASEIVVPGETGLLVPPRDVGALAESVRALLADPDKATRLGRAGRARVERLYDIVSVTRRIEAILEESVCIAGAGSRRCA